MRTILKIRRHLLILCITLLLSCVTTSFGVEHRTNTFYNNVKRETDSIQVLYIDSCENKLQNAKYKLVEEIDSYIKRFAPTSSLNAITLFELCELYNIDVKFVLAQGHIESHFGTKGMARKTNSVFNIFAFDGQEYHKISRKGKYDHPDYSIEPYLKLLFNDYITDNQTEYDLMTKFVNKNGKRYASDPCYENKLSKKFEYISNNTMIDSLMSNYNMYKNILMN